MFPQYITVAGGRDSFDIFLFWVKALSNHQKVTAIATAEGYTQRLFTFPPLLDQWQDGSYLDFDGWIPHQWISSGWHLNSGFRTVLSDEAKLSLEWPLTRPPERQPTAMTRRLTVSLVVRSCVLRVGLIHGSQIWQCLQGQFENSSMKSVNKFEAVQRGPQNGEAGQLSIMLQQEETEWRVIVISRDTAVRLKKLDANSWTQKTSSICIYRNL